MNIEHTITGKLQQRFDLQHLEVINESGNHNVPAGSQTHFKVTLVTDEFAGQRLLARHRAVHEALNEELEGGVHALALHTYTADEWAKRFGNAPMSPPCLGGKAGEAS